MTREARMMSGIILITVPTIQYGGYFFTPEEADWHRQRSQIKATVEKSGETKVRAERKYSSKKLAARDYVVMLGCPRIGIRLPVRVKPYPWRSRDHKSLVSIRVLHQMSLERFNTLACHSASIGKNVRPSRKAWTT